VAASFLARGLVVMIVLGLGLGLAVRGVGPLVAARWVVLITLLLSPQVHPWYLLWLLPLEVTLGRQTALVWSVTVLLAYVPLAGWLSDRVWLEPAGATAFEYGAVLIFLAWEARACREVGSEHPGAPGAHVSALTSDGGGTYPRPS